MPTLVMIGSASTQATSRSASAFSSAGMSLNSTTLVNCVEVAHLADEGRVGMRRAAVDGHVGVVHRAVVERG